MYTSIRARLAQSVEHQFQFPVRHEYIAILGVAIGNDHYKLETINWEERVNKCGLVLRRWKFRKLSFKGKVLVINSLVNSRLVYLMSILATPDWVISTIRNSVIEFLWNGKKPLIKYGTLLLPVQQGGLKLCDLEILRDSLRIKTVSKLIKGTISQKLRHIMLYNLNHYENMLLGTYIFQIVPNCKSLRNLYPYYREILLAWNRITQGQFCRPITRKAILLQPLFQNPLICDDQDKTFFNRNFIDGGIIRVGDLMYEIIPTHLPAEAVYECIALANPDNTLSVKEVHDVISNLIKAFPSAFPSLPISA